MKEIRIAFNFTLLVLFLGMLGEFIIRITGSNLFGLICAWGIGAAIGYFHGGRLLE